MMFASAGGGTSGYNPVQGGPDYPDDVETPATRGGRGDQGNIPAGRQRTVHFQPEERYWTDYLRIALPVIGLVLMLGLFWYWASTFIGGPSKKEPTATHSAGQAVIANAPASPTAAATRPAVINNPSTAQTPAAANPGTSNQPGANTPAAQAQTGSNSTSGGDNQASANQQATKPASGGGQFAVGDTVTTTDSVNLRSGPSTSDSSLTMLNQGDSLQILSGPEQGDNYSWYQVQTSDGTKGWVASDFIQKSGG